MTSSPIPTEGGLCLAVARHKARDFHLYYEPDLNSGCWLWSGTTLHTGYGRIKRWGRYFYAHRVAYAIQHGVDPGRLVVCHKCDTPACVNGAHLFLGTIADNSRDMAAKGRGSKRRVPNLTMQQRVHICERLAAGESVRAVALSLGRERKSIRRVRDQATGGEDVRR